MAVDITPLRALAIVAAGGGAGFINAIVGSGTLISFPTLVGLGFAERAANIANNIGLFPGSVSASYGYRRELKGQRDRLVRLIPMSMLGSLVGSSALLVLPSRYFKRIVPFLVLLGVALVLFQPRLNRFVAQRRKASAAAAASAPLSASAALSGSAHPADQIGVGLQAGVFFAGIYGGYFGAAQGVILMGLMGIALTDDLQRINATKNALATVVNGTAALVFVIRGNVPWAAAGLVAIGSIVGAQIGAHYGRRIPPKVLRGIIVTVGTIVAIKLLLS